MTAGGEVLNRRYRLTERLGDGGMGSVWQAHDTVLDRTVAVKELISNPYGAEAPAVRRERVRREALAMAKVEHPAIVTIHDLIHVGPDKNPWIVMGYARGRPLSAIIAEDPPLSEQRIAATGLAVLAGLRACHERSVYHRDVKPANIIVGADGAVRLVDFGIARIAGSDPLTEESKVLGTLDYLAPELLNGRPVGSATDLWALGVTLYYALTGRSPFRAQTQEATIAAIFFSEPPEPRGGGRLADLVLQMLRKRPQARPDGDTVAGMLRGVASTAAQGGQPPRPGSVKAPVRQPRDNQPARPALRPAPLHGMSVIDAAKAVTEWPADRAAAALLALGETQAADILNRCEEPVGGRLLSILAADHPDRAGRSLEMVPAKRAGQLLDHMSSAAAASALSLLPSAKAARVLQRADPPTIVGALCAMSPRSAAPVVAAMDETHAVEVLGQASPAAVAAILANVSPPSRSQALLSRLPQRFRGLLLLLDHPVRVSGPHHHRIAAK